MRWKSARDARTREVDDALFDEAEDAVPYDYRVGGNPRIEVILTPTAIDQPDLQETWSHPLAMIITPELLVAARHRGDGHPPQRRLWERYRFSEFTTGPWLGNGPEHVVTGLHDAGGEIHFRFGTPAEAERMRSLVG